MAKNVQISMDLFTKLWLYHCHGIFTDENMDFIKRELTLKAAKIQEHGRYTRYYNGDKSAWYDKDQATEELLKLVDEMQKKNEEN
ncbi:MAG: hypothetical protein IKN62_05645 [Elusimicrobia bacterium]|nr:hypothetical protein [Elusimicrobiota bacterium]